MTLDYASRLYGSSAAGLQTMAGSGSTFRVTSTSTPPQSVSWSAIIWDGVSAWQVTGSSSGYMGSYSVSGSTAPFPASNTQFLLSITTPAPRLAMKPTSP